MAWATLNTMGEATLARCHLSNRASSVHPQPLASGGGGRLPGGQGPELTQGWQWGGTAWGWTRVLGGQVEGHLGTRTKHNHIRRRDLTHPMQRA